MQARRGTEKRPTTLPSRVVRTLDAGEYSIYVSANLDGAAPAGATLTVNPSPATGHPLEAPFVGDTARVLATTRFVAETGLTIRGLGTTGVSATYLTVSIQRLD